MYFKGGLCGSLISSLGEAKPLQLRANAQSSSAIIVACIDPDLRRVLPGKGASC